MELRTAQLLLSLSLMAHVVQIALARGPSHSSLDLNEYVKDAVLLLDILDSEDNNNESMKAKNYNVLSRVCK